MNTKKISFIIFLLTTSVISCGYFLSSPSKDNPLSLFSPAQKRTFSITVHAIGELEAAKSTIISSLLGGEQTKVTYIAEDGATVQKGDLLVKVDATSYEKRVEELKSKIKEQESIIDTLVKTLSWEINQKEVDRKVAQSELFLAEMEYDKAVNKEGPMEEKKLRIAMEKNQGRISSLEDYLKDLQELMNEGYVNDYEMKQTVNKLKEEKDTAEIAKEQYLCYVNTTFPMNKHKAEAALRRARIKAEEVEDNSKCKIYKAEANLLQARNVLQDLKHSLRGSEQDLKLTELTAPTDGMVVLKEDYRSGQRRKTKIGDVLNKNQPVLDLPDLSRMTVRTKVREVDLNKIDLGKEATVEVDAFPELSFHGKITYIGVLALKDPFRTGEEKFFDVHIALDETKSCLRPGMTTRVTIHSKEIADAVTIPYQALYEAEDQSKYCYVFSNRRYVKRKIEVGSINEQWVVIQSGLKEGERVCLTLPQAEINL